MIWDLHAYNIGVDIQGFQVGTNVQVLMPTSNYRGHKTYFKGCLRCLTMTASAAFYT